MSEDRDIDLLRQCLNDVEKAFVAPRQEVDPRKERAQRGVKFTLATLRRLAAEAADTKQRWDSGNLDHKTAWTAASRARDAWRIAENLATVLRYQDGERVGRDEQYRIDLASEVESVTRSITIDMPKYDEPYQPSNMTRRMDRSDDYDCQYCGPFGPCDC